MVGWAEREWLALYHPGSFHSLWVDLHVGCPTLSQLLSSYSTLVFSYATIPLPSQHFKVLGRWDAHPAFVNLYFLWLLLLSFYANRHKELIWKREQLLSLWLIIWWSVLGLCQKFSKLIEVNNKQIKLKIITGNVFCVVVSASAEVQNYIFLATAFCWGENDWFPDWLNSELVTQINALKHSSNFSALTDSTRSCFFGSLTLSISIFN